MLELGMLILSACASSRDTATPSYISGGFSDAIEDNSFYVEEAFNQEPGVVQHISTMTVFSRPSKEAMYLFTQEWPLAGLEHQISYTIPYAFLNPNSSSGLGDVMLSYRYQLFTPDDWAAVSPRVSLIVPSGSVDKGLSFGSAGFQLAVPVSKRASDAFIAHLNVVGTVFPTVRGITILGEEVQYTLSSLAFGGSLIWLASESYNFMLEAITNLSSRIDENGNKVRETETIVNPGLRFAFDVGQVQVVPGIGVPVSFSEGSQRTGVFFYLSFEHPF